MSGHRLFTARRTREVSVVHVSGNGQHLLLRKRNLVLVGSTLAHLAELAGGTAQQEVADDGVDCRVRRQRSALL